MDAAVEVNAHPILIAGKGSSRQARVKEAAALLTRALATAAKNFGVKVLNLNDKDGQRVAIAILEDAQFGEENGETTLEITSDEQPGNL